MTLETFSQRVLQDMLMSSTESAGLAEDMKLALLKTAKLGTWYDDWRPYCMMCSTMSRMTKHPYGFRCKSCGNMIGWNLMRLSDSPLNR